MAAVLRWIVIFVVLDLYANGLSLVLRWGVGAWLLGALVFFPLVWALGRWVLGIDGLRGFGLDLQAGWARQLAIGFAVGVALWSLKYLVFWWLGKFEVVGIDTSPRALALVLQALLGMFFASAINDLLIRGYWLAFCRQQRRLGRYLLLATVLYALDDGWNAGFDPLNMLFSTVLGFGLALTVLRSGRLWLSIGIHWGGNIAFRMMSGFDGNGVLQLAQVQSGRLYEWVAILVTALLIPLAWWWGRPGRFTT